MTKLGLPARIEAKPEYPEKVEALLRDAVQLAQQQEHTVTWFAFRQDATTFGSSTPSPTSRGVRGTSRERSPPR
ncbi:hypothetical protein AB0C98_30205 [Streptomyces sp. NPDC048558]|uniref:hypothetical protein n=1 Tax=Streptomyces sp. NPDC048558 TaxID=3155759 RepID=UPI003412A1CA